MYKIFFDQKILKFFKKHKTESVIDKFQEAVEKIKKDPFDESLDIKAMRWIENSYRLRIGKYRFLYYVKDDKLIVYFYKAWKRWDIYK